MKSGDINFMRGYHLAKIPCIKGSLCLGVLAGVLQLAGCMLAPVTPATSDKVTTLSDTEKLAATYGIRVEGLRLSAAGSMLDFRYRVLDAQKAAPLLNGKVQPYLLDEVHGAELGVPDAPVLGRLRQTARNNNIHVDRTYFIMFGNPGRALQSGDTVTLLMDKKKITNLTVQ